MVLVCLRLVRLAQRNGSPGTQAHGLVVDEICLWFARVRAVAPRYPCQVSPLLKRLEIVSDCLPSDLQIQGGCGNASLREFPLTTPPGNP